MTPTQPESPFDTDKLIRHLWRRRYILILAPPIFVVVGYLFIRQFVSEIYESTAIVQLREAPGALRNGPSLRTFEPPVFEDMILSDAILRPVIEAARKQFPEFPQDGYEKIKPSFAVDILRTRETAVATEYSPVIKLTVKTSKPEWAVFLAETWLDRTNDQIGNLRLRSTQQLVQTFGAKTEELRNEIGQLQARETETQQELSTVNARLLSLLRLLTGDALRTVAGSELQEGLEGERVRLRLVLADPATANDGLRSRLTEVEKLIAETNTQLEQLGRRKVALSQQLDDLREQLIVQRGVLSDTRAVLINAFPDSIPVATSGDSADSGDFVTISRPVKPEVRVGPPRAIYSVIMAIALSAMLLLLMVMEFYVKASLAMQGARTRP